MPTVCGLPASAPSSRSLLEWFTLPDETRSSASSEAAETRMDVDSGGGGGGGGWPTPIVALALALPTMPSLML